MIQNTQNETYITTRIHKYYNQCTYCTKLCSSIQNTQPYVQWYKIEQKVYDKCDKRNSHISDKYHMITIASNIDRHCVTKSLLQFTTLVDTSVQLKIQVPVGTGGQGLSIA